MAYAILRYAVAAVLLAVGFVPLASLLVLLLTPAPPARSRRHR